MFRKSELPAPQVQVFFPRAQGYSARCKFRVTSSSILLLGGVSFVAVLTEPSPPLFSSPPLDVEFRPPFIHSGVYFQFRPLEK